MFVVFVCEQKGWSQNIALTFVVKSNQEGERDWKSLTETLLNKAKSIKSLYVRKLKF